MESCKWRSNIKIYKNLSVTDKKNLKFQLQTMLKLSVLTITKIVNISEFCSVLYFKQKTGIQILEKFSFCFQQTLSEKRRHDSWWNRRWPALSRPLLSRTVSKSHSSQSESSRTDVITLSTSKSLNNRYKTFLPKLLLQKEIKVEVNWLEFIPNANRQSLTKLKTSIY